MNELPKYDLIDQIRKYIKDNLKINVVENSREYCDSSWYNNITMNLEVKGKVIGSIKFIVDEKENKQEKIQV